MPSLRVFFGIELPIAAQNGVQTILFQLQNQLQDESIRYSQLKNLHITLQFLKAVEQTDIPLIVHNVREQLANFKSFYLELGQLELFPSEKHPHVISLGVKSSDILNDLSQKIRCGIQASHYAIENRPFRAHLTLARINKTWPLMNISIPAIPIIPVDEVVFFHSELTNKEPIYSVLERIRLVPHSS